MLESEITPTLTRLVLNRDVPFMHVNLIGIERDYKNKQKQFLETACLFMFTFHTLQG